MASHFFPNSLPHRWLRYNRQLVARFVIVAGVLILSAYLAVRGTQQQLTMIVTLLPVIGGVSYFMHRPHLAPAALIIGSLIVPFSIGTDSKTPIIFVVMLLPVLIVLWLLNMVRRREVLLVRSSTMLPVAVFAIVVMLSFGVGQLPWFPLPAAPIRAQIGGLAIFLLAVGAFVLVGNQVKELRWLELATWSFILLGGLFVVTRLVPDVAGTADSIFSQRIPGSQGLGATGSIFWVWLVALAGSQAIFNSQIDDLKRLALVGVALMTLGIGYFLARNWVSGWFPPLVVLGTLVWLRSWRRAIALALMAAFFLVVINPDLVTNLLQAKQYSTDTRLEAWKVLLGQMMPISPILGFGPANYYWYTPLFSLMGYYVQFNSHNQYVDLIMQTGVVGLIAYLWIMVSVGQLGWRLRSRAPQGFARAYVYGALAGLVGTLVSGMQGDWVVPFVYNIGLVGFRASIFAWIFLGGLVAVEQITETGQKEILSV